MVEKADPELVELAKEEAGTLEEQLVELEQRLEKVLLLPRDPNDEKDVIMVAAAPAARRQPSLPWRFSKCIPAMPKARPLGKTGNIGRPPSHRYRRHQGGSFLSLKGKRCVQQAEIRGRRPSGAAGSRHRIGRADSHFYGDRGGVAGRRRGGSGN